LELADMKTIIEMAREAGLRSAVLLHVYGKESALCDSELEELEQIKWFAALVRAEAQAEEREGELSEREACCAIVWGLCESDNVAQRTVDAIRARGNT
jgi:hypothetical protein